jgi:hypothetical protein
MINFSFIRLFTLFRALFKFMIVLALLHFQSFKKVRFHKGCFTAGSYHLVICYSQTFHVSGLGNFPIAKLESLPY